MSNKVTNQHGQLFQPFSGALKEATNSSGLDERTVATAASEVNTYKVPKHIDLNQGSAKGITFDMNA